MGDTIGDADLKFLVKIGAIDENAVKAFKELGKQAKAVESTINRLEKERTRIAQLRNTEVGKLIDAEKELKKTISASEQTVKRLTASKKKGNNVSEKQLKNIQLLKKSRNDLAKVQEKRIKLNQTLTAQHDKLTNKINKEKNALKGYNDKIKDQSDKFKKLNQAYYQARQGIRQFARATNRAFSQVFRTIKRIITTMVTLSAVFFFRNLIKQGAEFEHAMIRIGAVAKATGDSFKTLVTNLREIARQTIFTASEVAGVAQILAQAGFSVNEILGSLLPILKLTTATLGDLKVTTELVSAILRTFNMAVSETTNIVNVLTEATISSRADIERLAKAFRFAGPAGAAFGQSLETTIASLSKFIDLGLSASIAGTTFRRALIQLSQGTAKQIKVLQRLNVSLEEVNPSMNDFGQIIKTLAKTSITAGDAIKLFGARAGSAVFTMIQRVKEGVEGIVEFTKKLGDAKEIERVEQIYAKLTKSIQSNFLITKAELEDLALSIFQVVKPALSDVILSAREAFKSFNEQLKTATGKQFSDFLKNIIPLIKGMLDGMSELLLIFTIAFGAILKVLELIKVLGFAAKGLAYVMGLLALKTLIYNKVTKGTILALSNFTKSIFVANFSIKVFIKNLHLMTKAAHLAKAALAFAGVTLGLLLVSYAIEKVVGWLIKGEESSKDFADTMGIAGDEVQFASEKFQKLSDQTRIQINNEKELASAVRQRQIIMGEREEEAIRVKAPSIADIFLKPDVEVEPVKALEDALSSLEETSISVLSLINNDLTKALEKVGTASLVDGIERSELAINNLGARMKDFSISSGVDLKRVTYFANKMFEGFEGGKITELYSGIGDALTLMTVGAKKAKKAFDGNADRLAAASKSLKIINDLSASFRENMSISAKEDLINLISSTKNLADEQERLRKAGAQVIEGEAQDMINKVEILNAKLKTVKDSFNNIVIGGVNNIRKSQTEVNLLIDQQNNISESLLEISTKLSNKREEIVQKLKVTKDLTATQAVQHLITLNILTESLAKIRKTTDEIKSQVGWLEKRRLNLELSAALVALANEQYDLQEAQQKRLGILYRERKDNLENAYESSKKFYEGASDFIGTTRDINKEFSILNKQIQFAETTTRIEDANRQLAIMKTHETKILDLEKKVSQARANLATRTFASNRIDKDGRVEAVKVAEEDLRVAELSYKLATKDTDKEKLKQKIMELTKKQHADINKLNKEMIPIISQINKEWQDMNISSRIKPFHDITNEYKAQVELLKLVKNEEAIEKKTAIYKQQLNLFTQRLIYTDREFKNQQAINEATKYFNNLLSLTPKELKISDEIYSDIVRNAQEEVKFAEIMANGGTLEKVNALLERQAKNWAENYDGAAEIAKEINNIAAASKNFIGEVFKLEAIDPLIESIFGFEAAENADAMKKILTDYLSKVAEIWRTFYDKLREEAENHEEKLNDIRIRFDDMRRERELEIYNERVERMVALASLEEQLRFKGISDEQQRADLLAQIDQNLASSRLGTIEERQVKLGRIEEQIKALNELENRLGLSRDQVEQSSLLRLGQLQKATSDFYDAKRTDALSSIEAERQAEVQQEVTRHDRAVARIERERDAALAKALLAKQTAEKELNIEKEKDDQMKRLQADLVSASVLATAKIVAGYVKEAIAGMSAGVAKTFAQLGTLALVALPVVIAGVAAFQSRAKGMAGRAQGGPVGEQKKAIGGMIKGGHGGIDDIHTRMPVGSYVINKQSTQRHYDELSKMANTSNRISQLNRQVPVAVTSGEYAMFPPASIAYRDRLNQINRDRTGVTSERHYFGGTVGKYQNGGTVDRNSAPNNYNISSSINFSGLNMINGDSEAQVSELYSTYIRTKIQEDIDNKEIIS